MIIGVSSKIGSGKNTIGSIIQWLTNPRIHSDPNIEIGEDSIASYVSFEDWQNGEKLSGEFTNIWQQKAFADKLKDIVCLLIGCTREQLEDREIKEKELGEEWSIFETYLDMGNLGEKKIENRIFLTRKEAENYCFDSGTRFSYKEIKLTPRKLLQLIGTECGRDIIHPNIWINSLFADYKWPYKIDRAITHGKIPREEVLLKSLPNWIITDVRFPNEAKAIKDRKGILIRVNRYCYDSLEDYLVLHPDKEVASKAAQIVNDYSSDTLEEKLKELPESEGYLNKSEHESETALDDYQDWDYVVDNNEGIPELIEKVKEILIKEKII